MVVGGRGVGEGLEGDVEGQELVLRVCLLSEYGGLDPEVLVPGFRERLSNGILDGRGSVDWE